MTTATKTLYTAIGAGTTAVRKARELPTRVRSLAKRGDLTIAIDPRELPKQAKQLGQKGAEAATVLLGEARSLTGKAQQRATSFYSTLASRGQTVVKRVERSAPTKRAQAQTKTAKARVKAAATSVKKAAEADIEAVKAATDKVAEETA